VSPSPASVSLGKSRICWVVTCATARGGWQSPGSSGLCVGVIRVSRGYRYWASSRVKMKRQVWRNGRVREKPSYRQRATWRTEHLVLGLMMGVANFQKFILGPCLGRAPGPDCCRWASRVGQLSTFTGPVPLERHGTTGGAKMVSHHLTMSAAICYNPASNTPYIIPHGTCSLRMSSCAYVLIKDVEYPSCTA
jgi:hypothetical protein